MAKLNPKQERFCEEYVIDWNGTQAAIRAGYSEKAAKEQASRLLTNANITERIAALRAKHSERLAITVDVLTNMLLEDRLQAKTLGQTSVAVKATETIAKLHGKTEDAHTNININLDAALSELE